MQDKNSDGIAIETKNLTKKFGDFTAIDNLTITIPKEKMNSQVHTLSGGMKRRTSLTVALVHHPELIILDEPTVGVDPVLRRNLWSYFRELNRSEKRVTFLVTTHVFDEVDRMDELLLIYQGKLLEQGSTAKLKEKYNVKSLEEIFLNIADKNNTNNKKSSTSSLNPLLIQHTHTKHNF